MSDSKTTSGISLTGVLFLIFLVLKLTGLIDWSWWWVTSPLWIPIVLLFGVLVIVVIAVAVALLLGFSKDDIKDRIGRD